MARVEVSQSIGPQVIKSINGATSGSESGTVFWTETYTVHSYQLISSGISGTTNLSFKIYATNDDGGLEGKNNDSATNWQVIAEYTIDQSTNETGIMYSDIWNFKYAKCEISGTYGGANITVIEKHNP